MFLEIGVLLFLVSVVTSLVVVTVDHANSFGVGATFHDLFDDLNLSKVGQILVE